MSQTVTETSLSCAECGSPRPSSHGNEVPRPPCHNCGATAIAFEVAITEALNLTTSVSAALTPGDQSFGWSRRWEVAQDQLSTLLMLRTEDLSRTAILDARKNLFTFYVETFHIEDALAVEAASLGLTSKAVKDTVRADPTLALLGDLANLVKHHAKARKPISGDSPKISEAYGITEEGGWRLKLSIRHYGRDLDGLMIAQEAVAAWERILVGWALI